MVTVFDHDLIGSHDFLGKVEIPIHSLPLGKVPTPLSLVSDIVETGIRFSSFRENGPLPPARKGENSRVK